MTGHGDAEGRVFAVDAGGTSTRVVVRAGGTLARHSTGSVNPASVEPELISQRWAEVLSFVVDRIGRECGGWIATASLGGPDPGPELDRIRVAVALAGLSRPVMVSNDLVPLLLAPPLSGDGFVLVAGTGSACLAAVRGKQAVRVGGHEYLLSDEGSGYQIGLAGLRAALRAAQRTGPDTALAADLDELPRLARRLATSPQAKTEIAAFAPQVIAAGAAGDAVAADIIDVAATDLVSLVAGAALALGTEPGAILACGSLVTRSQEYADLVVGRMRERWPGVDVMLKADGMEQCVALAGVPSDRLPDRGGAAQWYEVVADRTPAPGTVVARHRPTPPGARRQLVVLVGCGAIMAAGHAPALAKLSEECKVHAVADISRKRREMVGDRFGVPPDLRVATVAELGNQAAARMLAVVAVPTSVAAVAVAQAAAAGYLVLAEKPVAATSPAARVVFDGVGGQVRVVHNYLARSDIRQARELLAAGAIGELRLIRLEQHDPGHFPGAGEDPDWRRDGTRGCLLDNAYHWVYVAETLSCAPVETVSAQLAGQAGATGTGAAGVDTLALMTLRHASGVVTAVQVGWGQVRAAKVAELHGTQGSLRLLGGGSGCQLSRRGEPDVLIEPDSTDSSYLTFYRGVFDALRAGRVDFAASADDCLRVLEIIDTAYLSAARHRTLRVPSRVAARQATAGGVR